MMRRRPAAERGHADYGWLKTYHTFSFSDYYDPQHMRFRSLRVINEDFVAPGQGFGTHPHQDMEIVTIVLEGAIEHRDSMGNGEVLMPGEIQRMTAGTGLTHSEFNPSSTDPLHLYQIWILPDRKGHEPSYEQKRFSPADRVDRWQCVASPDRRNGSLLIHQDATIHLANVSIDSTVAYALVPGRHAWLQVLTGGVQVSGQRCDAGDGIAISEEVLLEVTACGSEPAELMLFDLA